MERLRRAFEHDEVLLDLPADSIEEALAQAARLAAARGRIPPESAAQVEAELIRREREFSTAIGNGVAMPHAYLSGIESSAVILVRLRRPINMGAPDGVLTRYLFVLVGAPGCAEEHLDAITQIARMMADEEFRYDVRMATSREELIAALDRFDARRTRFESRTSKAWAGLTRTGRLAGGIVADIHRKCTFYAADFRDGLNLKAAGSTLYLYFACLVPAVTFGGVLFDLTGGAFGVVEMLVASAAGGLLFALAAGQPLVIVGGTGPVLVFTALLARTCSSLDVPFLPAYGWVGLWAALFLLLLAVTDACALIRYVTRFTVEVFTALIATAFVVTALRTFWGLVHEARSGHAPLDAAFLSLILGAGTFIAAVILSRIRKTRYLLRGAREFLADFGPTVAVGTMWLFAFGFPQVAIETIAVPQRFAPTTDRQWLLSLQQGPPWLWLAAAAPGLLLAAVLYFTQNLTSRLVNSADHNLQKGPGYHLDLAVLAVITGGCSLMGLPWLAAARVPSLNHLHALATVEDRVTPSGETREKIIHVCETRTTGVAISLLIGLTLVALPWLRQVPLTLLYGLLLFMGTVSLGGNQFFERVTLWITDPELYPRTHYTRQVPLPAMHAFTFVQLACLGVLWAVLLSPAGIIFPLVIALMVPVRFALSQYFSSEHLSVLDAQEIPDEQESVWV